MPDEINQVRAELNGIMLNLGELMKLITEHNDLMRQHIIVTKELYKAYDSFARNFTDYVSRKANLDTIVDIAGKFIKR